MTRLVYSESAYIRSLQISGARVFAFVEGGLDRPFMDRILELSAAGRVKHRVVAAKELPGKTGGKPRVIEWFKSISEKGLLLSEIFGKKFGCIFFVDKDADDFLEQKIESPHLVYTDTYDIEGHLFTCGDLVRALSDCALITMDQARSIIGNPSEWIRTICEYWADWLTLCMISRQKSINVGCSYERMSTINQDGLSSVDKQLLADLKEKIREKIEFQAEEFEKIYLECKEKVLDSIENKQFFRYFKGKWIKALLQKKCESTNIPDANFNGIGERVVSVLVSKVANGRPCVCSDQYVTASLAVIEQII